MVYKPLPHFNVTNTFIELCVGDIKGKCTLTFIKYTSTLANSALLHRKEYFNHTIKRAIKDSLWAVKHNCPRALVQANNSR